MGAGAQIYELLVDKNVRDRREVYFSPDTKSRRHRFSFEEKIMILGNIVNRQGKAHEGTTPLKQECNPQTKLCGYIYIYIYTHKCKDIPWKIKCRRLVDYVFAVFHLRE